METPQRLPLNQGQQAAADGFFSFLLNDQHKELIISGPGGVGKTFTMGHMIDEVMPTYFDACQLANIKPKYDEVVMTATTNKAAAVLAEATGRPTQTVHSYFDLTVKENFRTGETDIQRKRNWSMKERTIIFIDECSMIDRDLYREIKDGSLNSKIVYVGDHNQLAPIKEPISPIYNQRLPFYELTQPMRTNNPDLQALNQQLRDTVETGIFKPIKLIPGVIDEYSGSQMEHAFIQEFSHQTRDARVMAYTNARVNQYNEYIRGLRGISGPYQPGELLVSNSATQLGDGVALSVEEEVEVINTSLKPSPSYIDDGVYLDVYHVDLESTYGYYAGVMVPADRDHWDRLIKYYAKEKNWVKYFHLKNMYADLRPRDACTVHKAQGGTYKHAYVDLDDISQCRDPKVVARLLYVAFSRAKERVIVYGDLSEKFGGLVR
ncbi:DNA helicase [Xanthomonas phage RiverRider]|uniref:DNA helicase n=1 Tax=Xanthomonas phage RiverRider TaxID=2108116 RepID=A0A2P1JUU6_9CAUD|nr:exonuclease V [Xanthomonas phage RiverRider]AVO23137.1 DNA helicase [Xanthomonas phage RiverRider]